MPEGDTIRRAAAALSSLVGERLSVRAIHPRARATGVAERLDERVLLAVEAHGKHLLLRFEGPIVLRSHLGMSGRWRVLPAGATVTGAPWLVLLGRRHQAVLRGGSRLEVSTSPTLGLGPDVLAEQLDLGAIVAGMRAADPGLEIGEALLDQRLVAGIGNIWRSEALWAARVSPWLRLGDASDEALGAVVEEAAGLMRLSVEGATPPRSVYRRAGRPCRRCGARIASRRQGVHARTAYWCPDCQPDRGDGEAGA